MQEQERYYKIQDGKYQKYLIVFQLWTHFITELIDCFILLKITNIQKCAHIPEKMLLYVSISGVQIIILIKNH